MENDGPYHLKRMTFVGIGIIGPSRSGEKISYSGMSEDQAKRCVNFLNEGYSAGRKAERERCIAIAEISGFDCTDVRNGEYCGIGGLIANQIRGDKDGK